MLHKYVRAVSALILSGLVILAGCDLTSVRETEGITNLQTIQALTPSATPSPTITSTPTPTATATETVGPTPTASKTPLPTITPLPPTPTTNPALVGFSFCDQQAGPTDGRFSARLAEVAISGTPAYEQLVLRFELGSGSAPLGTAAACLGPADVAASDPEAPDPYALSVQLPGWLHDELYAASSLTQTLTFSNTRTITSVRVIAAKTADAGVTLRIGMSKPLPFRLTVERNPTRLVLAVAHDSPLVESSDPLGVATTNDKPALTTPLFALFDGEIWRIAAKATGTSPGLTPGLAGATNLTNSPETETQFAVSPDGASVAFCRAAPGLDPADTELPVPSTLWLMDADGQNARLVAQVGVSCADPVFSPDGAHLAFAVDETGASPVQRTLYSVPVTGGQPRRLSEGLDEWSRFAPQWLKDGALVFNAVAQDGRNTLFLRQAGGEVVDLGATVLASKPTAPPYAAFGRALAARDGSRFAVTALRDATPGADLIIFDAAGSLLEVIGAQRIVPPPPTATPTATQSPTETTTPTATAVTPVGTITGTVTVTRTATRTPTVTRTAVMTTTPTVTGTAVITTTPTITGTVVVTPTLEPALPVEVVREGPFWTRPVAWDAQGHLLYLTNPCAGASVQAYQLYRWSGAGRSEVLLTGQTLGALGPATLVGETLAYVRSATGPIGPRNPVTLWLWAMGANTRGELLNAERGVAALAP